jgi:hypothetical protein
VTDPALRCSECGAPLAPGTACRDRFDFLLGRESVDPALAAVHHLTVLCYTVQHPLAFDTSLEGHAGARALLWEAVSENLPAREMLRRNRAQLRRRDRPRLRNRGRSHAPLRPAPAWRFTAADVVNGPEDDYAGRVQAWAKALIADDAQV